MNVQIFGTKKSFDTKKAQRFFKERRIKVQFIDLKEKEMSKGELTSVMQAVGGIDKLLNPKAKAGIDLGDIVDFNGDQTSLTRHATHFTNGVDQGVNVAQAGHGISRICQASVDDNAHIHAGLGIGAVQAVARAVAKRVFSGGIHYTILHVVEVPCTVYHHVELGAHIVAVLGMNAGEPHVE